MVGVANVAAHRQAKELAAEVVLQPSAKNLFAIVKIFRPNEADHSIDEHRRKAACDGIRARLTGLLVHSLMCVRGERAALAGLKVHDVVPHTASVKFEGGPVSFIEQTKIDTEGGISEFGAGDRLEQEIDRRTLLQRSKLCGDVGENATLCRNRVAFANRIDELEEPSRAGNIIGHRINADNRIARSKQ